MRFGGSSLFSDCAAPAADALRECVQGKNINTTQQRLKSSHHERCGRIDGSHAMAIFYAPDSGVVCRTWLPQAARPESYDNDAGPRYTTTGKELCLEPGNAESTPEPRPMTHS